MCFLDQGAAPIYFYFYDVSKVLCVAGTAKEHSWSPDHGWRTFKKKMSRPDYKWYAKTVNLHDEKVNWSRRFISLAWPSGWKLWNATLWLAVRPLVRAPQSLSPHSQQPTSVLFHHIIILRVIHAYIIARSEWMMVANTDYWMFNQYGRRYFCKQISRDSTHPTFHRALIIAIPTACGSKLCIAFTMYDSFVPWPLTPG